MKAIAAVTLVLLAVVVTVIAWHAAVFDAYSRDFGSLSPARFESMNARMNLLELIARSSLGALAVADIALIVLAARKRAYVVLGVSIALAVALALFFLIAQAAVGPAMIGLTRTPEPGPCAAATGRARFSRAARSWCRACGSGAGARGRRERRS